MAPHSSASVSAGNSPWRQILLCPPTSLQPRWLEFIGWGGAHFLLCLLGLLWRDGQGGVSPIWPAAGVMLYLVARFGWRAYALLVVGKVAATLICHYPPWLAFATNGLDPLKAFAAVAVWRQLAPPIRARSARSAVVVFCAAALTMGVTGAALGSGTVALMTHEWHPVVFFHWCLGDTLGALIVGAFTTSAVAQLRAPRPLPWLQLMVFGLGTCAACYLLFRDIQLALSLGFVVLPFVHWGAMRLGLTGAAVLNLIFAVAVVITLQIETRDHLLFVLVLLGVGVVGGLACGALAEDLTDGEARSRRDLAAQRATLDALQASEQRFSRVFALIPDALAVVDAERNVVIEVNESFEKLLLYSRAEAVGRTIAELDLWCDLSARDQLMQEVAIAGEVRRRRQQMRRKDGTTIVVEFSTREIEWLDRRYILSILDDVTDLERTRDQRRELEAQLRQAQKMEAIGTLAGGVAHDFNNVITSILSNAELGVLDRPGQSAADRFANIVAACRRARDLVGRILTFSRHTEQQLGPTRLSLVTDEAVKLLRASVPANVTVLVDLSRDDEPVMADSSQIHQVLLNLCTNALHAMRPQGGTLSLQLMPLVVGPDRPAALSSLAPGRYQQIVVRDTGGGMSALVLAHIFEPFFTTKAEGEGTGLGLAVVRGIIEAHHGLITVQSREGEGTTFTVILPFAASNAIDVTPETPKLLRGRGQSILLIDDEPAIASVLRQLLEHLGYRVEAYTDPRAALARYMAHVEGYDLVLCDQNMPGVAGLQLAAQFTQIRPTRLVIMSGDLKPDEREFGRQLGVRKVLAKPIDAESMAAAVAEALA